MTLQILVLSLSILTYLKHRARFKSCFKTYFLIVRNLKASLARKLIKSTAAPLSALSR